MDIYKIKGYHKKNSKRKGKVIPMSALKELEREEVKSQSKKSKLEIAREIANEIGIHGKSFGRTMSEHHKQGR